jgi:hypothetical protein
MEVTGLMQLVGSLGASGVLAWYCWYVTSTTLPKLVQEFREESKTVREHCDAKLDRFLVANSETNETMRRMLTQCAVRSAEVREGDA